MSNEINVFLYSSSLPFYALPDFLLNLSLLQPSSCDLPQLPIQMINYCFRCFKLNLGVVCLLNASISLLSFGDFKTLISICREFLIKVYKQMCFGIEGSLQNLNLKKCLSF